MRRKKLTKFQLRYDPADIPKLAAEYMATPYEGGTAADKERKMEDAGQRIAGGDFSRRNLEIVCEWKSKRRIGLLTENTDAEIKQALKRARATSAADVKGAVSSLTGLAGVGVKMASAILTAIFPERYTVFDFRALEALGVENTENVDAYALYLEACRSMAKQYGVKLRDFDRANWQWSKNKSKRVRCC